MTLVASDDADVNATAVLLAARFPESTEVNNGPPGPFVVSHEIWDQAAGVSPFLGRVAPADRVGGWNRSPRTSSLTIRSIVRVHADVISEPLRGAGVDAVRSPRSRGHREMSPRSRSAVHAVAGRGVGGSSPLERGPAATSQLAGILKLEGWEGSSDLFPISKGLILAQNERWRRGLGMQVGRAARPVAQG